MKKRVILIALAALVPLASCVAPYPYYRAGYYDRGYYGGAYAGYGYGYRGDNYGYGGGYYGERRYAPWADYNYGYDD